MGRLHVVAHQARIVRVIAALVLATLLLAILLPLSLQAQHARESARLRGTVRDSKGKPVANAVVYLQEKDARESLTAHTDTQGNYGFADCITGVYASPR